jgi:hypothetical protein
MFAFSIFVFYCAKKATTHAKHTAPWADCGTSRKQLYTTPRIQYIGAKEIEVAVLKGPAAMRAALKALFERSAPEKPVPSHHERRG